MQIFQTENKITSLSVSLRLADIFLFEADHFRVEVEGDPVDIEQSNTLISISPKVKEVDSVTQIVSGNRNITVGNVIGSNIINGDYNVIGFGNIQTFKTPPNRQRVNIYAPKLETFSTDLSHCELKSEALISRAFLDLETCKVELSAKHVHGEFKKNSVADLVILSGQLGIDVIDNSTVNAKGAFSRIKVHAKKVSNVITRGDVAGSFESKCIGNSGISHKGNIGGTITKETQDVSITAIN
jgi:hypothetical protein